MVELNLREEELNFEFEIPRRHSYDDAKYTVE